MVAPPPVREKTRETRERRRIEGDAGKKPPATIELPGLIDDEVEGGRVVRELDYVLSGIDDRSPFVDNLVDLVNDYGGRDYRRNIELLDGRGAYSAAEIVPAIIMGVAAAAGFLTEGEREGVASGVLPDMGRDYLSNLRGRFGSAEKMAGISNQLNSMSKDEIKEFLDSTREGRRHPVRTVYEILTRK